MNGALIVYVSLRWVTPFKHKHFICGVDYYTNVGTWKGNWTTVKHLFCHEPQGLSVVAGDGCDASAAPNSNSQKLSKQRVKRKGQVSLQWDITDISDDSWRDDVGQPDPVI